MNDVRLILGDCVTNLDRIETGTVDAVICDPPYPCIKRSYGYWTVDEWWTLIVEGVIPQVRRILKPTGSAVFILQPNSEHVGQMRGWLFEFQAWVCREWNMVQDVWWWNFACPPTVHCHRDRGLMRPSMKAMVWAGAPNCYRNQDAILIPIAEATLSDKRINRHDLGYSPSGLSYRFDRIHKTCRERGGSTPFNAIVCGHTDSFNGAGAKGHSAGTPLKLADWWTRYIVPPGGTVCDPFLGSGTMGLAAMQNGCSFIGIERVPEYFGTAYHRIKAAQRKPRQLEMWA